MSKKSQKGSALVMALLIGLMASVLGTALYSVSTTNAKQVQQQSNQLQADYYAKSGVNLALGIITNHNGDYDGGEFWGTLEDGLVDALTDDYTLHIRIIPHVDYYDIFSEGFVRSIGQSSGVSVAQSSTKGNAYYRITRKAFENYRNDNSSDPDDPNNSSGGKPPTLDKIFAVGVNSSDGKAVEITGSSCIYGDVGVNSILAGSVSFAYSTMIYNGDLYIGPGGNPATVASFTGWGRSAATNIPNGSIKNLENTQSYSLPVFPEFPTLANKSALSFVKPTKKGKPTATITESGHYSSIDVTSDRILNINVANKDILIRTESLEVSGDSSIVINQTGTGKVVFYVDNDFTLGGSGTINNSGNYNSLIMYYAGTDLIDVGGSTKAVGSIYA